MPEGLPVTDLLYDNGKASGKAVMNLFGTFGMWQGQTKALVNMIDLDKG